ncbi:hypothetical protein BpHYR1_004236 [Brachionus plicatilis]|uniref:Uncharacterized protein n=1 Tax=Brachionus plicatilis TaxID=10195 RepID=A0A3M7PZ34_BRAPC|nr:hypothetical protein BpHYR1_004236 [Brachionus plicatilis]
MKETRILKRALQWIPQGRQRDNVQLIGIRKIVMHKAIHSTANKTYFFLQLALLESNNKMLLNVYVKFVTRTIKTPTSIFRPNSLILFGPLINTLVPQETDFI